MTHHEERVRQLTDAIIREPIVGTYLQSAIAPRLADGWQQWLQQSNRTVFDLADRTLYGLELKDSFAGMATLADAQLLQQQAYVDNFLQVPEATRRAALEAGIDQTDWNARIGLVFDDGLRQAEAARPVDRHTQTVVDMQPAVDFKEQLVVRATHDYASSLAHNQDQGPFRVKREEAFEQLLEAVGDTSQPHIIATAQAVVSVRQVLSKLDNRTRITEAELQKITDVRRQMSARAADLQPSQVKTLRQLAVALEAKRQTCDAARAEQAKSVIVSLGMKIPERPIAPTHIPVPLKSDAAAAIDPAAGSKTKTLLRSKSLWGGVAALAGLGTQLFESGVAMADTPANDDHIAQHHIINGQAHIIDGKKIQLNVTTPDTAVEVIPMANDSTPPQSQLPAAASPVTANQPTASIANTESSDTTQIVDIAADTATDNQPTIGEPASLTAASNILTAVTTPDQSAPALTMISSTVDTAPTITSSTTNAAPTAMLSVNASAQPQTGAAAATSAMDTKTGIVFNQSTDQIEANKDFQAALQDNTVSFNDLLNSYEAVLASSGTTYDVTTATKYLQAILNNASEQYEAITNSGTTVSSAQITAKQHLVNAVMLVKHPELLADDTFAKVIAPDQSDIVQNAYVQATLANFTSPQIGDIASQEGVQTAVMTAATTQFAMADASLNSHNTQLGLLQQTAPAAYNQVMSTMLAKQASQRALQARQRVLAALKSGPSSARQKTETANTQDQQQYSSNMTAHQLDVAAAKAMIKMGGPWYNRGMWLWSFLNQGVDAQGSSGALGSLMGEDASLSPERVQVGFGPDSPHMPASVKWGKGGYGVAQFTWEGYQHGLLAKAKAMHMPEGTFKVQSAYLFDLIRQRGDVIRSLNQASTAAAAARVWTDKFEHPQAGKENYDTRESNGRMIYQQFLELRQAIVAKQKPAATTEKQTSTATFNPNNLGYARSILYRPNGTYGPNQVLDINQSDLHTDGIATGSFCGPTTTIGLDASLKGQVPHWNLIHKVHSDLENIGEYNNNDGITDHGDRMRQYMEDGLNLHTKLLVAEGSDQLTDDVIDTMIAAMQQNDNGNPTLIQTHTAKWVSGVDGMDTSGHYLFIRAVNKRGFYVENVGADQDNHHFFTWAWLRKTHWLDSFAIVSLHPITV